MLRLCISTRRSGSQIAARSDRRRAQFKVREQTDVAAVVAVEVMSVEERLTNIVEELQRLRATR